MISQVRRSVVSARRIVGAVQPRVCFISRKDRGPLQAARGLEMYAHFHTALGHRFDVKIVR